jgi:hypothetical protein
MPPLSATSVPLICTWYAVLTTEMYSACIEVGATSRSKRSRYQPRPACPGRDSRQLSGNAWVAHGASVPGGCAASVGTKNASRSSMTGGVAVGDPLAAAVAA